MTGRRAGLDPAGLVFSRSSGIAGFGHQHHAKPKYDLGLRVYIRGFFPRRQTKDIVRY
jgi:hypothetical protein